MRTQTKVTMAVAALLAVALGVLAAFAASNPEQAPAAAVDTSEKDSALIRSDSRIIGAEGTSDVTFVEFLDFECEACGAFYPLVEEVRKKYDGEVTFVARYFPIPGHVNGEPAARAVESAARQGQFEAMYQKMYETQTTWAEQKTPQDDVFRGFAEELGLDMEQFDADYASQEVADRVQKDVDDGTELGVAATPTFYIDGKLFEPKSEEDFYATIDEALGT